MTEKSIEKLLPDLGEDVWETAKQTRDQGRRNPEGKKPCELKTSKLWLVSVRNPSRRKTETTKTKKQNKGKQEF